MGGLGKGLDFASVYVLSTEIYFKGFRFHVFAHYTLGLES